jgi:dynein light chain roadblock-type
MVWSFLTAAGSLVDELDKEDEVKLLRLRTKKNELVIVPGMYSSDSCSQASTNAEPDPKFILVAIHDTPPA